MTGPLHRGALPLCLLLVLSARGGVAAPGAARQLPITANTALVMDRWVDAVTTHAPGQMDDALLSIENLTYDDRVELSAGLSLFRTALAQRETTPKSDVERHIVALGSEAARDPGLTIFVDRAMLLHGDAAIVAAQHPELAAVSANRAAGPGQRGGAIMNNQVIERDGEVVGAAGTNWNWAFARTLINLQVPSVDIPFVAGWFHATTAFMMSRHLYGDAKTHLKSAANFLPKDARILFDRACYAETEGLPESQAVLADQPAGPRGRHADIQSAGSANSDAERLFGAALDVDPEFVEARVRLARLLTLQKRDLEAAAQLTRALASPNRADPVVTFYAHLFAGRVERAIGNFDAAATHFHDALALFPNAQSALLGESEVALLRSDVAGALAPVRHLDPPQTGEEDGADPWWVYEIGIGRNANVLLAELWTDAKAQGK